MTHSESPAMICTVNPFKSDTLATETVFHQESVGCSVMRVLVQTTTTTATTTTAAAFAAVAATNTTSNSSSIHTRAHTHAHTHALTEINNQTQKI